MDQRRNTVSLDYTTLQTRSQGWLWKLFFVFLSAGGIVIFAAILFRPPSIQKQTEQPLDGKLIVYVRTSERGTESIPIEKAGALPVRANGIMSLEANFSQPARAYFVWFDCQGQVRSLSVHAMPIQPAAPIQYEHGVRGLRLPTPVVDLYSWRGQPSLCDVGEQSIPRTRV